LKTQSQQDAAASRLPLVTVIIPAYNYGQFIAETLQSVQSQTYEHWEGIVVDDGSTDDTSRVVGEICAADDRIKYVKQNNAGLASARNTGLAQASGEYIQFLDADDLIESQKLERQVQFLEQHPEVEIVFSEARYFQTGNSTALRYSPHEPDTPWTPKISAKGIEVLSLLLKDNIMVVSSPLLRRAVTTEVGPFDGAVRGIEDWHYWLRCALKNKHFHYEDGEGMRTLIRMHPSSMSTDKRMMLRSTLLMHRKVVEMVADDEVLQLNRQRMCEREGFLGIEEVVAGELMTGIAQLLKAAAMDRLPRQRAKWFLCAVSAPFVSKERLQRMVTSSVSGSVTKLVNKGA
jgi:glycosyltransferase involved in cell wall biosynthesis